MNKQAPDSSETDMRPEYDFSRGARGKYAASLREEGYTIREYNADGTYTETHVLGEKTVTLAPDVWEYFPNSQAVNHALRTLISLIPEKPPATKCTRVHPQSANDRRPATQIRDAGVEYNKESGTDFAKGAGERTTKTYTAVVEKCPETGLYVGYVPGFPGAHTQAETLDELQSNLREVIDMLLEDGEPVLEAEFVGTQTVAIA